ncbi:MAG: hypothetical protein Q8R06_22110 [Polaromonas sp.]|uniref:transcriptional regulator domain-containing protein n=1 Tax=Polaromonas sp. TaxID=1869339 RepID=UPI002734FDA9|nr:hypothetical protein [Polaromonas sp.]MDP3799802.1 hypothetical protein [Polaromonas sp.]
MDVADYEGFEKWSNERWAWEFLRRNKKFLAECKAISREPSSKRELKVAKDFGLLRFKSVETEFHEGEPEFAPLYVHYQARLKNKDTANLDKDLKVGDIFLWFNLNDILENKGVLDVKLEAFRMIVETELQKFAKLKDVKPSDKRIKDSKNWLRLIRVLDAWKKKTSAVEMAEVIYPKENVPRVKGHVISNKQKQDFIKERKKTARRMTETGYLNVAKWDRDPEVEL